MVKPKSIVQFELLYAASFVMGLIATVQTWSLQTAMLADNPAFAGVGWLPYASLVIRAVVTLALWYFVVRGHSVVARWVIVAFAVWSMGLILVLLYGLATGATTPASAATAVLQNLLYILATITLFRPDTRAWFGETGTPA